MATIQELLDQEAHMSNNGHGKSELRMIVLEEIRARRGNEAPVCFGEDDCSTNMLVCCPWRIDCGC